MSFLTPLYLLGALGLAIPIILHLLHDRPKNKQPFGSLMFLDKTSPPVDRKRRPTHLLLLLLRCLALLLLAFVFARPFVAVDNPADAARRDRQWVTVLLDRSASMQRGDLWARAKAKVQSALGRLGPGDQFSLIAFDDATASLAEVKSWVGSASEAEVNDRLERLAKPGFGGSNLGQALVSVGEAIQETQSEADEQPFAKREIIVVSDLQKGGSHLDEVQGYEWPAGVTVTLEQIAEDDQGNAGIEQVASGAPWITAGAAPSFRISNSPSGIGDELEFLAHTTAGETFSQKVHVPPGRSRVVELPGDWVGKPVERLAIRGDAAAFDNQFHFAPVRRQTVRIVYVGDDKPNDAEGSLFYLANAFQPSSSLDFQVEAVSGRSSGPLPEADLFVIGDAVDDSLAQALGQAIEGGVTALMVVRSPSQAANLGQWLGADGVVIRDVTSSDFALLDVKLPDDPLLAVFRDARYSDFTNLHFWNYRELQNLPDDGIDVLARFDSGAPAWLAARRGRLLLMASGWTPADSQLALSTKFIPLLYSILRPVLDEKTQSRQFVVGSKVDVSQFNNGQAGGGVTVLPPGDGSTVIPVDTIFTPAAPGLYTANGSGWSETFAVNLPPAESRTEPVRMDQFKKLGLPMSAPAAAPAVIEAAKKTETHRLEYWQWALAAVLLFVTLETVLAAKGSRSAEPVTT
ncbi:MAG: BatA domain-containing protein [Verrucomicrobia bacterium]|nr:BatA domain-containing protein [Verrucomicrobiota bacterium]